jgi:adenosine deaminase/adenosine deaminase CECR1
MPKGGDIHTHVSGAVYAESYLHWAAKEKRCVNPETGVISEDHYEPCDAPSEIPVANTLKDSELYGNLVDKLSLRNLAYAGQSGHDQFFEAFAKFAGGSKGEMIAELSNRAARQNIAYLELMLTVGKKYTKQFAKQITFDGDFKATYNKFIAAGLKDTIANGQQELAHHEKQTKAVLGCGTENAQPGCAVERRYLLQIKRISNPSRVFSQLVYAFETVKAEPLAVGLNMVAPEDNVVALRDYDLHMQMINYLSKRYPNVAVSLHAGELMLGIVPPKHLHDHIRQAVEVAGAKRIGHGVDVLYEDKPFQLMQTMKEKDVLVEICLSSNDAILGVKGKHHPFPEYLEAGVPVTLATDDEGISRIDLSHEYQRAAQDYGLSYPELKTLARNSIRYSFLAGENLWTDGSYRQLNPACQQATADNIKDSCKRFLDKNDKAKIQWKLEEQFNAFENSEWF